MKKIIYSAIPVLFLFASCEETANVDVPEADVVLVLSSFITPQDSFIRVKVSRSIPVFGPVNNTNPNVSDATVTIYGNSSSVQLNYNATYEWYEIPTTVFPVNVGNEYHLVVTEPGGLQADAYTTVPLAPPSFTCSANTIVYSSYEREARFTISVSDPGGTNNYYRFNPYNMVYSTWNLDSTLENGYWNWTLFSDANEDGSTVTETASSWYSNYNGDSVLAYYAYLFNCNYDYYRFHQSIYNYTGDDPFSEPSLIYTNVNEGLGIFAAANASWIRIPR